MYSKGMDTRSLGSTGESEAVAYLEGLGWKILARNIHLRFGEIDILADNGEFVVIVEVKMKRSHVQGTAAEMVTPAKQQTLRQLANLMQQQYNKPVRIDVIAIDNVFDKPELTHYPFAVGE